MRTRQAVRLEPVSVERSERYRTWVNDPKTHRWMLSGHTPITADAERCLIESLVASDRDEVYEIVLSDSGESVGLVGLHHIDRTHGSAELGIMIGEPQWRGRGVGLAAIEAVLDRAFAGLELQTVHLGCVAENEAGLRLYEKAGFTRVGAFRQRYFLHDEFHDSVAFDMTRDEWGRRSGAVSGEAAG